eukprot:scaffold126341_cov17-Prasinocladus_malaysianus.AAC.1
MSLLFTQAKSSLQEFNSQALGPQNAAIADGICCKSASSFFAEQNFPCLRVSKEIGKFPPKNATDR